ARTRHVLRQHQNVLDLAELAGVDVVETADRSPAEVSQSRVGRGGNAVAWVIRLAERRIYPRKPTSPFGPQVTDAHAESTAKLVLNAHGVLVVVLTRTPPGSRLLGPRQVHLRLSELQVIDLSAFAVGGHVRQHTIGNVVAIAVIPRTSGRCDQGVAG